MRFVDKKIERGIAIGGVFTLLSIWFMRNRLLNFEHCPEFTTDYCSWNLLFLVTTFGPVFVTASLVSIGGLFLFHWLRGDEPPDR